MVRVNWLGEAALLAAFLLSSCTRVSHETAVDRTPASLTPAKCIQTRVRSWLDEPEMIIPVQGYAIPGGVVLDGDDAGAETIYLTKQFFDQTGIPVPANAKPTRLWTYRYYRPQSTLENAARGSGRDHLIAAGSSDPSKRFVAVKGSGTNPEFSSVNVKNGNFNPSNFRQNGLQAITDNPDDEHGGAVVEWILARNFEEIGVPVVPHRNLRLLPKELQDRKLNNDNLRLLAVQNNRIIMDPRESFLELPPTRKEKLKLAGAIYFHNIAHGALNLENLTAKAQILDVGHVSFGYEFSSGIYRCTICVGDHGSSWDRTMKGVLDYYFPGSQRFSRSRSYDIGSNRFSYKHNLSPDEATDFMQEVASHINATRFVTPLSASETADLMALTQEALQFFELDIIRQSFIDAQTKLVGITADVIRRGRFIPSSSSASIRLYLQISALKHLLGPSEYQLARKKVLNLLGVAEYRYNNPVPEAREVAERLFLLFDRILEEKKPSHNDLKKLFRVYMPASEIQDEIRNAVDDNIDFNEAAKRLKAIIKKHRKPVQIDPKKFLKVFLET